MSNDTKTNGAEALVNRILTDKALQTEFTSEEAISRAVERLTLQEGYQFTPDELSEAWQKKTGQHLAPPATGALQDEDLEAVAGGGVLGSVVTWAAKQIGKAVISGGVEVGLEFAKSKLGLGEEKKF